MLRLPDEYEEPLLLLPDEYDELLLREGAEYCTGDDDDLEGVYELLPDDELRL